MQRILLIKWKDNPQNEREYSQIVSHKELMSRYIKNTYSSRIITTKSQGTQFKKWAKDLNRCVSKEHIKMVSYQVHKDAQHYWSLGKANKTTRYHFTLTGMAVTKRKQHTTWKISVGESRNSNRYTYTKSTAALFSRVKTTHALINRWKNKENICRHNGILFSHVKERNSDTLQHGWTSETFC